MIVQDLLHQIEFLIEKREIRKAEVAIARQLKRESDPCTKAILLIYRVRARLLSGRFDDALADLQTAFKLDPHLADEPHTIELQGDVHFARFELAKVGFVDRADAVRALSAYERILSEFPMYDNLGWIYYQKGRVLLTEKRIDEAANCFQVAMLNPSTVPALTAYCYERLAFIAFYEQRDARQAIAFLNKAVVTYPASEPRLWLAQVYSLESRVLREMRQHERSRQAAQNAIAVASSAGPDGRDGLADALLTAAETAAEMPGCEHDVIALLTQFLQVTRRPVGIDVTRSRVFEMLGDAYLRTKQYQASIQAFQNALQSNPYHPWEQSIYYRMARATYHLGEYDQVIALIERIIRTAQNDNQPISDYRIYAILGNAHYALRHYDRAAEAYETALSLAPPNIEPLDIIRRYLEYARSMQGSARQTNG